MVDVKCYKLFSQEVLANSFFGILKFVEAIYKTNGIPLSELPDKFPFFFDRVT